MRKRKPRISTPDAGKESNSQNEYVDRGSNGLPKSLGFLDVFCIATGVLPSAELDHSLTPITDGAASFMGNWGVRVMGLGALFAFFSTGNAGIMAASRYLYALSKDELMPRGLKRLSRRTGVPTTSVLVTGLFVSSTLFLKLDILVEAASLVLILGFMMSCVCFIVLRESHVQNYRPSFRAPFYPFTQILGLLGFRLLISCPVLDISPAIDFQECAGHLAKAASTALNVSEEDLFRELMFREEDTSSVINPFLAVPRIIVPGSEQFEIVLLRAKEEGDQIQ